MLKKYKPLTVKQPIKFNKGLIMLLLNRDITLT